MTSSAPVEPAMSTAVSKDHSDAVEKSVGIRMRFQGYTVRPVVLSRAAGRDLRRLRRRHDVSNHRLRLGLGLHDLQRHLLVPWFERVARNERILHRLVELHFERAP